MVLLRQKLNLLRTLLAGDSAHSGPVYADIFVSSRCNLRCRGCRYHSARSGQSSQPNWKNRDISFEIFENLAGELKMMGTTKLVLVGDGEPLLHPRFLDMVSLGKELGFHITVITNGTLLDDTTIQALIDSRLDILHVSLWTGSVEGYQQQYPGTNPDYFHKVIEAMEKVVKQKRAQNADLPLLRLHHPINRHNFQDIDSVADLAVSIGCNLLSLSPFLTFKGQYIECALAQDQERAVYDSLRQLRNRLNSTPMNHNIDETMLRYRLGPAVWKQIPCYAGWFYTRIGTDGRVFPCCRCEGSLGDLHQNSFSEIWNNSAYRTFRMQAMTPRGLAALQNDCDCEYCCHISANLKVHRVCRWLSPFIRSSDK